ncbi:unnamed protein product [Trifolium pratense]|uniref:Uncharacterized protein n=1 Tax=Trifolium pratense TaxID=57577 RepID=A0ACB0IS51_TRIPR|nr:unnamed protein product [Trifolium pratense]
MSPLLQRVVLLCVLTLLSVHNIHGVHDNSIDLFRTHVNVVNTLEDNLDLTLHCKSKDDDLGEHLLHQNDSFSWSFRPKWPIGTTLFFCSFAWTGEFHYFDIFIDGDTGRTDCDDCNWNVHKSGPCRIPDHGEPICFPWNKGIK